MSDTENQDVGSESEEFTLAALAGFDTSDIAEVRFENLPGGSYVFEGVSAKLEKKKNRDDEDRFVLTVGLSKPSNESFTLTSRMTWRLGSMNRISSTS